jgi:hypothetical protein
MPEDKIAQLIRDEYEAATRQARVPPPELVWMRAQLRAREEAARKAARPIVLAQSIGIAAFLGLLVSLAGHFSLAQLPEIPVPVVELILGGWLVLAPVAVYLAFSRE